MAAHNLMCPSCKIEYKAMIDVETKRPREANSPYGDMMVCVNCLAVLFANKGKVREITAPELALVFKRAPTLEVRLKVMLLVAKDEHERNKILNEN